MIDNCLLVIIYRRGHILEFSVTAESISRSQDCLSVKSCVDTVICNLKLRENAILTFAPIRNIWIKTREPRLKKLICVKILTCQKWNLGEIWYFSWRAAAARELGRAGKIQTDVPTHSYTTIYIQGVPKVSSHFVLVVFSASRARTEFHFTIFQQPRRRRFQNSPYFPPYVKNWSNYKAKREANWI